MTLEDFLEELSSTHQDDSLLDFCRKNVLHGTPFVFSGKESDYYEFRKKIAEKFEISFYEIYITGSAKLGFSPFKRTKFSLESDIDVAIVSEILFDRMMWRIHQYQMDLRRARRTISEAEIALYHEFLEYAALGWFRPDKLPLSFRVSEIKREWFDFFNSISYGKSEIGNFKVSSGIFKSYQHLEKYTVSGLRSLRRSVQIGRQA